jgi:hypothetical protein
MACAGLLSQPGSWFIHKEAAVLSQIPNQGGYVQSQLPQDNGYCPSYKVFLPFRKGVASKLLSRWAM